MDVIQLLADINAAFGTATATDACGAVTDNHSSDGAVTTATVVHVTQTRTFTARDACGNTSTASRTVTWTADLTPPVDHCNWYYIILGCNPTAG